MRFLAFTFCLFLAPAVALATSCGTRDLLTEITDAERQRLDELVAAHPYPEGVIFKAEKPDSVVTVVGTIHIPDPRLAMIADMVQADVASADVLVLEATSADQTKLQSLATTKPEMFFLTEGPTLIDLLTEEEWAQITDQLSAIGVPGFFAAKFKPWYLAMTLAIPPCILTEVMAGKKGLDAQLEDIAVANDVPIATLDNVEQLLDLLAGDPLDKQLEGLRMSLQMQEDGDAMTTTLIERYFQGKIRETWEYSRIVVEQSAMKDAGALFEEMNQALLVGRNEDWEPKIASLVDGKKAVIAVGAAHLSGEDGVVRSLERAGYQITTVYP